MAGLSLLSDLALGEGDGRRTDVLGFEPYAAALAEAAKDTMGPFTIGILGDWGTGKTSLMRMIQNKLLSIEQIIPIWFNAWRFEREDHPIVPLVAAISYELERHEKILRNQEMRLRSLREILQEIASSFQMTARIKLPVHVEATLALFPKKKQDKANKLNALLEDSIYYSAYETLSKIRLGDEVKVVVFIDDLDRCFPEMAIKLLEAIKLVLSQPGFIFIIGVSRSVIEAYHQRRYEQLYGISEFNVSHYLDKIIQLPWPIPPIGDQVKIKIFTSNLLNEISPEYREKLKDLIPLIGSMCGNNPRAIIRFINNLMVCNNIHELSLLPELQGQEQPEKQMPLGYFAVSQILQQRWPKIFQRLYRDPDLCLELAGFNKEQLGEKYAVLKKEDQAKSGVRTRTEVMKTLSEDDALADILMSSDIGKNWLQNHDLRQKATEFIESLRVVTAKDLSLLHRSWRAPEFDEKFNRKMYRFDAFIHAAEPLLDRIESVTYDLRAGGYPEPLQVKTKKDRPKAFKLKELAWGSSLLRAEVKIENQAEPIRLERHITLTEIPDET